MKCKIEDLAIFGGEPAFKEKLHVGRPNIGDRARLLERFNDILDRRWFTNDGPYVLEFEQKIAEFVGVKNCIAMCNATVALEIVIKALELKGEVIVPSFTFIATSHALQWMEITPVFCDVDPLTHNIDPLAIEKMITPRTSGIIGVHLWGRACDVERIEEIARRYKLKVIYDAAHAFGCSYRGKMIGCFGDAEVYSFHATKFFNTFEGGAVVTNNDELAAKIRLMKNFGFQGYDRVIYIGMNGKMNEICAAMGITSIESIEEFIKVNYNNYCRYREHLECINGIRFMTYPEQEKHNFQYIVLEIDENITRISRDWIVELLHKENIIARRYFYPGCHQMEPYRSYFPHASLMLPVTSILVNKVMCLPTGTTVTAKDIDEICEIIKFIVARGEEIKQRLERHFGNKKVK
ncbi:MAG: aminotransferase class I/II-fold pyridoxal phosphate-dependent enzyme [Chitinispirillaceae bacterium]|nr:aminotransferase class I/II-fold pyridoxal phosphate-dependent enzyme [Chitinispirillaceae bacterium]